jgi:hypothetical protein
MALFRSAFAKGQRPAVTPSASGVVVTERFEFDLSGALTVGDIVEIGCIPARCRVTDVVLITDDLDTNVSPTLTLDVGVMSGEYGLNDGARTSGNEFFAADTVGRAGGASRMTLRGGFLVAAAAADRGIGVKAAAGPATSATTGKITLLVSYTQ